MAPIPIDLWISVLLGLGLAACARRQIANAGPAAEREAAAIWGYGVLASASFAVLIRWPAALYLHTVFPAWSWMYFVDPERLPLGSGVLLLGAHVACVTGGYGAGGWLLRRGPGRTGPAALATTLGLASVLAGALAIGASERLLASSSFAEFRLGSRAHLGFSDHRLPWLLLVAAAGTFGAAALTGWTLIQQGRDRTRLDAPPPPRVGDPEDSRPPSLVPDPTVPPPSAAAPPLPPEAELDPRPGPVS